MTGFERPPAELDKLVTAWSQWTNQDEAPGRTMSDLKLAGLDLILEDLSSQSEAAAAMFAPWAAWEKGKLPPAPALAELEETGVADLIAALTSAD